MILSAEDIRNYYIMKKLSKKPNPKGFIFIEDPRSPEHVNQIKNKKSLSKAEFRF